MSAIPTDAFAAIFQLDAIAVNNISVLVLGGNARMIFSDLVNETNSGTPRGASCLFFSLAYASFGSLAPLSGSYFGKSGLDAFAPMAALR